MREKLNQFFAIRPLEGKLGRIFFQAAHPMFSTVLFLPLSLFFVALVIRTRSLPVLSMLLLYGFGMFWMTFVEYGFHRFLFHPSKASGTPQNDYEAGHWFHHQSPKDPFWVTTPPLFSLAVVPVHFLLWWALLQEWTWALLIIAGCFPTYVAYEWTHYAIHHWTPRFAWQRKLWAHHLSHHFKNHRRNFGVTSSFWDWVLGTKHKAASHQSEVDPCTM